MTMNRENYKRLGDYIRLVDVRNRDLAVTNLLGVSISKTFIPSIANTIGTDMSTYKIVEPYQFAYGPVTSRNGDKITFALYKGEEKSIVSSAYVTFEVIEKEKLDPDYLMMWALRPEFDRYARFMSNGSAREVFDWDCMCGVELPVPPISEQRKIVHDYQVITDRIELLQKMNEKLEELLYADFQSKFQAGKEATLKGMPFDEWKIKELSILTDFQYGKMVPEEERCEKGYPIFSGYGVTGYYHEYMFEDPRIVVLARGVSGTGEVRISPKYSYITNLSIALTLKDEGFFAYLYEYLAHDNLRALDSGSAQSMITIDSLNKYLIAVPPKEKAVEYDRSFRKVHEIIEANLNELETLNQLSSIQLQRLAKGA